MMALHRRGVIASLLAITLLSSGCSIMSMPYFMFQRMSGEDSKMPPQLIKISAADKKDQEPLRVLLLAYCGLVAQPEFVTADRDLTALLSREMKQAYQQAKDNVVLVATDQINRYKDEHPDWHLNLRDAGKHFHADYVVYLEIEALSLYENKSFNQFLRGRADIDVSVIDMHHPDDFAAQKEYHCEFPRGAPQQADDTNVQNFQRAFFGYVAKQLSWYFVGHETRDDFD